VNLSFVQTEKNQSNDRKKNFQLILQLSSVTQPKLFFNYFQKQTICISKRILIDRRRMPQHEWWPHWSRRYQGSSSSLFKSDFSEFWKFPLHWTFSSSLQVCLFFLSFRLKEETKNSKKWRIDNEILDRYKLFSFYGYFVKGYCFRKNSEY